MPFWQREVLRSGVSMTFGQTYELDLPKTGLLGSLVLYARSTAVSNAFLTVCKWRLADYISKIEVVGDGSEVIKSYDGLEALAAAFYDDFREPVGMHRTYATTPQRQWIPIHFGRRFLDEVYGLDLSRFNQVTLKITNDASATYFSTDITLDVIAYWIREGAGALAGYLREEVWKSWTPAAAEVEYNDLPVGLPIRRILLEARPARDTADAKNNSSMHRSMSDIDFTFRTGQLRVFKGSLEQLGHLSVMEMPCLAECRGSVDRTQGYGFEVGIGYVTNNLGYGAADVDGITTALANMRKDVQDSAQESGYRPANGPLAYVVRGHGYQHCVPLWLAKKEDLADMLDPTAQNVVKVDITCQSGTTVTGTDRNARSAIILSRLQA